MSSLKLKHSGGNAVSLNPPTSAPTSSDVAFKLPNADGSANQLLKTDGSGNLGWATDGNTWVKLSTTTITSSTADVTFTSSITGAFDTYKTYAVAIADLRPVTDDVTLQMRLQTASGDYSSSEYSTWIHAFTDGDHGYNGVAQFQIIRHGIGNGTTGDVINEDWMGLYYISGFPANNRLKLMGSGIGKNNSSSNNMTYIGGTVNEASATTGLKFFLSSGNIALGKFTLYGIKT
tara:strand:+ start:42 stop:740 length:699 start_codon:yes stop_codon:yes gene_type:complete